MARRVIVRRTERRRRNILVYCRNLNKKKRTGLGLGEV